MRDDILKMNQEAGALAQSPRQMTPREHLEQKKRHLEAELANVNNALEALTAHPDIENMTAESRSNHHCRRSIRPPSSHRARSDADRIAPSVQGEDHARPRKISQGWRRCRRGIRHRDRACHSEREMRGTVIGKRPRGVEGVREGSTLVTNSRVPESVG